ncbi:methionine synthase [Campylobacter sp. MIT 99-7217]|uniref:5-methyltetrahydropteroyltriglutamate-- homocysteine S-methyltransferase n=1 Tax=Campylobacter sp. MIT 99-7217 TaxID=535091 RepID=UPI0011593AF9|nr:5-methyltetrahydropteroyltriglutamate--homocysteine S-methyltransferase [Campylobacter sp. MIT 99-7217]TQR33029.1 methionine synthase [Campylobacter sp. MIT 99-7217]
MKLDQVGSFLRPLVLKQARENYAQGKIDEEQLRSVEDSCIIELLQQCDKAGIYYLSDGEFRRSWWHLDFYWGFEGLNKIKKERGYFFKGIETRAEGIEIVGDIKCGDHPFLKDFARLMELAKGLKLDVKRLKLTIPSPSMLLYMLFIRGGKNSELKHYGKDFLRLKNDILKAYADFYAKFAQLGGVYLQLDDTSFGSLCDESFCQTNEINAENLCEEYVDFLNESLKTMPKGVMSAIHICRGNYRSRYVASGGYMRVAKKLFGELRVNKFFLEFDDERAGDFEPLKFMKDQIAVLGILTSKVNESPSVEELKTRVKIASKFISPKQIELSTQCGFSSTEEGNEIAKETQWQKIALLNETLKSLEAEGFFS